MNVCAEVHTWAAPSEGVTGRPGMRRPQLSVDGGDIVVILVREWSGSNQRMVVGWTAVFLQ